MPKPHSCSAFSRACSEASEEHYYSSLNSQSKPGTGAGSPSSINLLPTQTAGSQEQHPRLLGDTQTSQGALGFLDAPRMRDKEGSLLPPLVPSSALDGVALGVLFIAPTPQASATCPAAVGPKHIHTPFKEDGSDGSSLPKSTTVSGSLDSSPSLPAPKSVLCRRATHAPWHHTTDGMREEGRIPAKAQRDLCLGVVSVRCHLYKLNPHTVYERMY